MQLRLWNNAQSSATTLMTVSPTGAGTFASSVTVGTDIILSAANPFIYGGTAAGGVGMSNIGGQTYIRVYGASHATSANVTQFVNAGNTSLSISSTGAATFASSVTTGGQVSISYPTFNAGSKIVVTNTETTGEFASSALELRTWDGSSIAVGMSLFQTFGGPFNYAQLTPNQTNLYAVKAGGFRLATGNAPIVFSNGSADIDFSSPRMVITSGGNVGINTTTPQSLLSLGSGVNAQKLLLYDANNNFKYGFGIQVDELRQFYPSNGFMTFGTISTSDGSTFTERMRITSGGAVIARQVLGKSYAQTSSSGTTSIVDTGITYDTGDHGGYGRGATYKVVFNGNPNAGGSAGYYAQYIGILMVYTGWNGSAVTTYIEYTPLASGNNIGALTLTPVFWNGSTEASTIGVYTGGAQIRLKISGYNSSFIGQDQAVYLTRLT
jgi:hypothetical protein